MEALPSAFIWRRLHSLTGVWLTVFLVQHLLVNSQAALLIGHDGEGFIHSANALESLPLLPILESLLLGVPIIIHMIWGIKYLFTAKYNSFGTDGSTPDLAEFRRNRAYTWQRITSWLLVIGISAHVVHMRFVERPLAAERDAETAYMVRVDGDEGLQTLAARLGVHLYDAAQVQKEAQAGHELHPGSSPVAIQAAQQAAHWIKTMEQRPLQTGQVIAVAPDFGRAELLMLRNAFQQPVMLVLYTLFVLAACFHGFNGLWTALITWGITLSDRSQRLLRRVCVALMLVVGFLGLAAVWGTYWINLRY
jgi:succinate dehydrogenase / fumarate reductase cytochrome b subunit